MVFRDLNLGTKQILGFGLVLLLMAGANIYSLARLASLKDEINTVTTNWLPRVVTISHINLSTAELRTNQLQLAFATEQSRDEQESTIVGLLDRIDANLDAYEKLKQLPGAQGLYSDMENLLYEEGFDPKWEEYLELSFAFLELSSSGDSQGAVALLNGQARDVYEDFSADLQDLVHTSNTNSLKAAERAERTFNEARNLTLTLLISALALSAVIALVLVRVISVPIGKLERAAQTVAGGNLNVELDIAGKDEIGSLARSFEQMAKSLRDAQQQLVMKEKMASLGNLVAGVAHEINSPIGALHSAANTSSLCVQRITESVESSAAAAELKEDRRLTRALKSLKSNTDVTVMASERIGTIVQSLKNFARLDEAEYQKVDIHEGLESTLNLLQHEMKSRIETVVEFGDIPAVHCYPNQLNQVFMNVLTNAMEAIEGAGTVTIETTSDGEHIHVKISDTGIGIPQDELPRIFDPGFTTKGVGVGTGLGLSTSFNILESHGARTIVDSEVGKGTEFTIVLPISPVGRIRS